MDVRVKLSGSYIIIPLKSEQPHYSNAEIFIFGLTVICSILFQWMSTSTSAPEQMPLRGTLKCISSKVSPYPLTHAFLCPGLIYSVILLLAAWQSFNLLTVKLILCPPTTALFNPNRGAGNLRSRFFGFFSICVYVWRRGS